METTTIILIIAAGAIILMIYLRFFKKEDDKIIPEQDPRKDEYYDSPETESNFIKEEENKDESDNYPEDETTSEKDESDDSPETGTNFNIEEANKEFDAPEEEITRIIPDEEIEQYSDENEKEIARITNYFICNGLKNLTGTNFFDIQENIILAQADLADLYADIHQIFQINENRFIAITDLPGANKQVEDQNHKTIKGILGIIKCWINIGKGSLEQYERKNKQELEINDFPPEKDMRIGKHLLHAESDIDLTAIELLCNEMDKLQADHAAYIFGRSVYIRIKRPACMTDVRTMVEILMNFEH